MPTIAEGTDLSRTIDGNEITNQSETNVPTLPARKPFAASVLEAAQASGEVEKPESPEKPETKLELEKKPESDRPDKQEPEKSKEKPVERPGKDKEPSKSTAVEKTPSARDGLRKTSLQKTENKAELEKPKNPGDEFVQPTDTKATRERFREIGDKLGDAVKARAASEEKIKALEKQLAELTEKARELPEDVKDRLKRAQILQRRLDIENDPEVKARFKDRITASEKVMTDILRHSLGLNDASLALIEKNGGVAAFTRSHGKYRWTTADGQPEEISASELFSRWLETMPSGDADVIRGTLADQARTRKEEEQWKEAESAKADEYFKKESESRTEQMRQAQEQQQQVVQTINDSIQKAVDSADWLKDAEIPEGDEEAATRVREENEMRQAAREFAKVATAQSDPAVLSEMVMDSMRVYFVERQLSQAQDEIAALKEEVTRLKNGSRTIPRPGTARGTSETPAAQKPERQPGESSFAYNVRVAMAAQQNGTE